MKAHIIWRSAASIGEEITRQLARDFGHSTPRPRPHVMGLAKDRKPRKEFDPFKRPPASPAERRH